MKTIFKTIIIASAALVAAGCGNNAGKQTAQTQVVEEVAPSVSVVEVVSREVPQTATYTSTVQPYVKNNIAPQMAGRITKINAEIGFEGHIATRFAYTLKGGYKVYGNAPLQTLYVPDPQYGYMPGLGYTSYQLAYASMDFLLDTEAVRVDGNLRFNGVTSVGKTFESLAGFIFPAPFTGDVAVMCDYNDRLYAGVDCEFSTSRDGRAYRTVSKEEAKDYKVTVPGYADLGVSLEYRFRGDMSFWARGGNLLGMTIQRELLYAEKGPYFTVGICLNL